MSNFTNSPLVSYTRISPNRNSPRTEDKITKIIVHHMAGAGSVESFGEIVASEARQMSANYAIGNDGRIGLYCEEKDRCWCSSSRWADNRGIAIEVSNSKLGEPWPVSTKAWNSLVALCADICKRNGIPKMTYTGDTNGVLMFHRWFAATGCVPIDTTEVLTRDGWVPIRDIKVGDVIATVSPKDFSIRFDNIENMTPVHKDTVFTNNGMTVTREHRVLYSDGMHTGYQLDEYQKICDKQFTILNAGTYPSKGMDITSSEMVFLLEMQRLGTYDEENKRLEFTYIMESKVQYFHGLLMNLGYEFRKEQDDLGPVRFYVTDQRAWDLCKNFLSGKDFNWKWLEMNTTQFSYFIYKATSHVDTGWNRKYTSDSIVNIDIIQALCALNDRGSRYVANENALYVTKPYRTIDPGRDTVTEDDIDVACVTVKSGCFLMRQNGVTTITGNCPGEYLFSRAQQLCDEVNAILGPEPTPTPTPEPPQPTPSDIKVGSLVSISSDAVYYNNVEIPDWVKSQRWYVVSLSGDRAVLGKNESGTSNIQSAVSTKYLTVVENAAAPVTIENKPYMIRLAVGTPIYTIKNTVVSETARISFNTIYTIIFETVVDGVKYGKLKSGDGWIKRGAVVESVDNTINPGDTVVPLTNQMYDGGTFVIYEKSYKVLRVDGNRAVISSDGVNVTAAVNTRNLKKI